MFEASRQIRSTAAGGGEITAARAPLGESDFSRLRTAIWRGKFIVLATTIASLLTAFLIVAVVPHRYTAVTQILIDPMDLHAVGNDAVQANQMSDAAVLQVESQVRVLTSDSVLGRVVKSEGLAHDPEFSRPPSTLRRLAASWGLGAQGEAADPALAALNRLKRSVVVRRAERTYVVDVSVTSRNPEQSARLANAVAQAYLTEQTAVRSDAARQVSQSLSARLNELKTRVRDAEDRVESFKAHNNLVGANGQLVSEQQLSELNNQLGVAHAHTAQARARYEEVQRVQQAKGEFGAFPEAVQSPTITALRSQYAEIMRREAEQMTSLGDRHPAVIEIQAQADRLKRMIDEEINRIALSARSEYDSARANEDMLSRSLETLKHNSIATNQALVTLRELQRDVQASRAVYESFLVRARETGEQERLDTKNIRVISQADPPLRRSSPPSNLLVALAALMLGIGAGSGIAVLRAPRREGEPPLQPARVIDIRMPDSSAGKRAAAANSVPLLAVLPDLDWSLGLTPAAARDSVVGREIAKVAEAVRKGPATSANRSVLIASEDEEDAGAVALALAGAAAASQSVLLIDTDLERRTLSAAHADRSDAGLVDVAVGRRALADVVVRDPETNISMLPFVSPSSRRGRDIKDEDIASAFAQTKSFAMVIVAATNCEADPSAGFFAGLVDHIVLVAKADTSAVEVTDRLVGRFGENAHKIRGAVLTGTAAA